MPTTTLTYQASVGQRLAVMVGKELMLKDASGAPRDATKDEVEDWLIYNLKARLRQFERSEAHAAAEAGLADADITKG